MPQLPHRVDPCSLPSRTTLSFGTAVEAVASCRLAIAGRHLHRNFPCSHVLGCRRSRTPTRGCWKESRRCTHNRMPSWREGLRAPCERCRGIARRKGGSMSTEGNDPTAGEDAGPDPTPEPTPEPDPTPDPAPTESLAAPEPPPAAPDPEPEPEPAPTPPPPTPPPAAESTAAAPQSASPAASFDFAAVPRSVWISAGGALILLISVFFSWYTATASATLAGSTVSRSASGSGWDSAAARSWWPCLRW